MAAKIEAAYSAQIGKVELVPGGGGCFELTLDGEMIYSKLATGSFPNEDEVVRKIGQRVG